MSDDRTIVLRPPILLPLAVVIIAGLFYLGGKRIEIDRDDATLSVSGEGKVFAAPDIAQLSFGIQTGRQKTAAEAMKILKDGMDKVLEAVKKEGIEEKDISTESFWLNPVYDWTDNGQVFRGFEAQQSMRVKVRNLDKVSGVLGAATNAGANQAGSVSFTIDDPESLRAQAREKAIAQAKEKATKLSEQLGETLGELQGFSEGYGGWVPPPMMTRSAVGMGGGGDLATAQAVPLPPGEQEITVSVTLTYELE